VLWSSAAVGTGRHRSAWVHFPAHQARYQEDVDAGTLLMIGTFGDPQKEGSMSIFTTREAAEDFVAGDPFVLNGVARRYEIRAWNEVLTPP
jgi:uncharacterized protein